jgi:TolB protein
MNPLKLFFIVVTIGLITQKAVSQKKGYSEVQLTNNTFDDRYASYNKFGNSIVFESNRDGHWQIYIMSIDGSNQKRVITSEFNDRRPTWHPYKSIILFESDRSGTNEIYTFDLAKGLITKIPIPLIGNKTFAQFAPNGKEIVFNHKVSDTDFNIYIIFYKGKRLKKIIDNKYKNSYPRYSPRGDEIAYFSRKSTKNKDDEIYAFNIIGITEERLTRMPQHNISPTWSHGGLRIAYVTTMDNKSSEIYIMNKDGSSKQRITYNNYIDSLPNWSPNDVNLLTTRYKNGYYQIFKIFLKEPL